MNVAIFLDDVNEYNGRLRRSQRQRRTAARGHRDVQGLAVQLVQEGKLGLDVPIASHLPQPLPSYASPDIVRSYTAFAGLANDERWRLLTARILLTHSGGFANVHFLEPDRQLRIHFEPGSRYAYSGDRLILLQFVLEQGLGLDVGAEMHRRLFAPNGMTRTSLLWHHDFRHNLADGFTRDGRLEPHDERCRVHASGSMDTSIADMGRLAASSGRTGLSGLGALHPRRNRAALGLGVRRQSVLVADAPSTALALCTPLQGLVLVSALRLDARLAEEIPASCPSRTTVHAASVSTGSRQETDF